MKCNTLTTLILCCGDTIRTILPAILHPLKSKNSSTSARVLLDSTANTLDPSTVTLKRWKAIKREEGEWWASRGSQVLSKAQNIFSHLSVNAMTVVAPTVPHSGCHSQLEVQKKYKKEWIAQQPANRSFEVCIWSEKIKKKCLKMESCFVKRISCQT